jgi:hypothetical protein
MSFHYRNSAIDPERAMRRLNVQAVARTGTWNAQRTNHKCAPITSCQHAGRYTRAVVPWVAHNLPMTPCASATPASGSSSAHLDVSFTPTSITISSSRGRESDGPNEIDWLRVTKFWSTCAKFNLPSVLLVTYHGIVQRYHFDVVRRTTCFWNVPIPPPAHFEPR